MRKALELKTSRYNIYFPSLQDGVYLVFNTLTEGTALVSESCLDLIRTNPTGIPSERRQELIRAGVIVSATTDEMRIFSVNHNSIKYSSKECSVMVYTTYGCNLACSYCYESFLTQTKNFNQHMNIETANAIVKFIKKLCADHGIRKIRLFFFGGEPLLNPDPIIHILQDLMPWVNSNGIDLSNALCTNGTVPLDKLLPKLATFRTFFQFTIDGPKPIHDKRRFYRGGKGTFDEIMENISLASKAGIDFGIRINFDKRNLMYIETFLQQLRRSLNGDINIRFAEVIPPIGEFNKLNPCSWATHCFMGSDPYIIFSLMKSAQNLGMTVMSRPIRNLVYCDFLKKHSYIIDPFNDVYKCEGLAGIKDQKVGVIGSNGTIEPTFAFYDWVSHDPLQTECRDCVYLPACGGGCPCLTFEENGTYHSAGCTIMFKGLIHASIEYYIASLYPGILSRHYPAIQLNKDNEVYNENI